MKNRKNLIAVLAFLSLTPAAFANSCPELAGHYVCSGEQSGISVPHFNKSWTQSTTVHGELYVTTLVNGHHVVNYADGIVRPDGYGNTASMSCPSESVLAATVYLPNGVVLQETVLKTYYGYYGVIDGPEHYQGFEECHLQ